MGDKLKYYTVDSWHGILLCVVPAVIFEDCFKAWCRGKKYPDSDWPSAEGAVSCFHLRCSVGKAPSWALLSNV